MSVYYDFRRDDPCMSGIEEMGLEKSALQKSCSFINPFNLTMNNSEKNFIGDWNEDDDSASDYQPSLDATLRQDHNIRMDLDSDDEDIDIDIEKGDSIADEPAVELGPNISRIKTDNDLTALLEDRTFLVFLNQILVLAKMKVENCAVVGCHEEVVISTEVISSALYLKWTCKNNHLVNKWCSQPVLNRRLHSGDLLFSSALLISGCNFQKISLFARFLKLAIPLSVSYLKIQRTYLAPTLDEIWEKEQNQVFLEFKDKELILLGDGRMDSPGHCAQYCTYTFMEMDTKKIVCIVTMDKRMTDKKSTNLEKACFLKGLLFLLGKGLKIAEIVTDAHVQVEALMRREFPNIKHSFDIWHGAKNLGKKIIKAGQEKEKKCLLEWTRDIVNHFWYSADVSKSIQEFMGVWCGMIHHVVNEHEWSMSYTDDGTYACKHGPLCAEREKGWLKAGSPAHDAAIGIVMDKRFIKKIPYYLNCRSTAELENFQNLILKYASKRHSFNPVSYRARNLLAALDNNAHCQRQMMVNKDGSTRYQRYYSKTGIQWSVYAKREDKDYHHVPTIIKTIVENRLQDPVGMNRKVLLDVNDPRRVSAVLAPTLPPSTADLVAQKISRFNKEDPEKTLDYSWTDVHLSTS
ncbi:uncharacterized protein [Mytilus edulis]|uniref:uncharacterized protein n=1 Tax=Mytilus edulis TaxID=6550 RepID=UPI0039EEC20B